MQSSSPVLDWLINNSFSPCRRWGCLSEVLLLAKGLVWLRTGSCLRVGVLYALLGVDRVEQMDAP